MLWNYLMMMVVWKFALVLVVGNIVVLKFSDTMFEMMLFMVEIVVEFLFLGVFNVIIGDCEIGWVFVEYLIFVMVLIIGLV